VLKRRSNGERFRTAIEPHTGAAYNLALWLLGNAHDAEDAVQSSLLRAYRNLDQLRCEDGKKWFLSIVRNTCINEIRRQSSRRRWEDPPQDDLPDPAWPHVDAQLVRDFEAAALRQAIEKLPGPWREVIVLREFEGLTYAEIAEVTGSAVGTVMSRLSRARQRLLYSMQRTVSDDL
jgi:RNA polymerase sigma-70 factor (ECF subfamily)